VQERRPSVRRIRWKGLERRKLPLLEAEVRLPHHQLESSSNVD
jgi:hypothetical protein